MTLYCKVKKRLEQGWTANAIAKELGVPNEHVIRACIRLGLWHEEPEEPGEREEADRAQLHSEVLGALADGVPDSEIVERHGVSRDELRAIRKDLMAMREMKGKPVSHWYNLG